MLSLKLHKGDFLSQIIHSVMSKGGMLALGIINGVIAARVLKPEGRGLLEMYLFYPQLFVSFGELGVRQAAAFFTGQKRFTDQDMISSILVLFIFISLVGVCIVSIVYWKTGLFQTGYLVPCLFIIWVPAALLQRLVNGFFLGKQEVEKINYSHLLQRMCLLLGFVGFVWLIPWGLAGAGVAHVAAQIIPAVFLLYWLLPYGKIIPKWVAPIPKELLKMGVVYAGTLFLLMLNYRVDVVMLGSMSAKESVGIYSVGVSLCELLKQIPLSVGVVLFSHATAWKDKDLDASLTKLAQLTRILFFFSVVASMIYMVIVSILLPLVYGQEYTDSVMVVKLLLPGIIALNAFVTLNLFVAGQGKPQLVFYAFIPALIVNVILNAWWIPVYDYFGAAMASSVSYTLGCGLFFLVFSRRYQARLSDYFIPTRQDYRFVLAKISVLLNR